MILLNVFRIIHLGCWFPIASLLILSALAEDPDRLVRVTPEPRQVYRQAREIEVLVHFGINTFTGNEVGSGKASASQFNPTNLSVFQWVSTAQSFGAKSVTLVCKHHDGFCLWSSAFTDYSVKTSPWRQGKGDLVREVSDACREQGMGFGIYLSPSDLHEPSYGQNHVRYNDYFLKQLSELCTDYGPITEVFFDGAKPAGYEQIHDWQAYYRLIRKLQPNAVISVRGPDARWVGNEFGIARESEWSVIPLPRRPGDFDWPDMTSADLGSRERLKLGGHLHWYPALADVSLRQGWFWNRHSHGSVKPLNELLRIYEQSVGRNAVLALNIAPDTTGRIPEPDVQRLKEFGEALKTLFTTNLLTVTGVTTTPFEKMSDGTLRQEIQLATPLPVRYVVLQEDIRKGQRVEKFEVEAIDTFGRSRVLKATTIGWKRILKLEMPQVKMLKVAIRESRAEPLVTVAAY